MLEAERDALQRARDGAIDTYDKLACNWRGNREVLQAQYNVDLPQASILQSRAALDQLRKRPENQSTERAIRAFLAFIFAGLLLLKLFEPGSVRLYLSDALQQEYDSYMAGTFDPMLPATERSTAANFNISPQRFLDFLVRVGIRARRLEEENEDSIRRALASNRTLKELANVRGQIEDELKELRQERMAARELLDQKTQVVKTWQAAIGVVEGDIRHYQETLASLEKSSDPTDPDEDELSRFEHRQVRIANKGKLRRDLTNGNFAVKKLRARNGYQGSAERAEEDYATLDVHLSAKEEDFKRVTKNIRVVRQQAADDQARTILGGIVPSGRQAARL